MSKNSYWMWHYGDYEIYHTMQLHLRREEQGHFYPPFWKISQPYASVKFKKSFFCEKGCMVCRINGKGYVCADGKNFSPDVPIELSAGQHTVEINAFNDGGLPAAFVESDICPSDGTWLCNHFAGEFSPVGFKEFFDSKDKSPEIFPFSYIRKDPVAKTALPGGTIYDFGTELFGYLNIRQISPADSFVVFYGESREEALDTEHTYIYEEISGKNSYRLRQRAFRYIYVKGATEKAEVSADYEYLPLEKAGDFKCDNALFNKIYSVAEYTFRLNCREAFLDGIKRDRWVWSGDAYQSARINRYLFADKEIEQRTIIGLAGKRPIEQHINTIMDYTLLWIIMLYEHYMTYKDEAFLHRIYPMAEELLEFCETRLNGDGFIEGRPDDWIFIDWSDIDKCGAVCAEQMLLIKAYLCMACFSWELGKADRNNFAQKAEALRQRVNKYYWSEEKGAFIDSYASGRCNVTRHANIFAVIYGIADIEQQQSILHRVLKNDAVTKITTPYFEGYELDALARLGEFEAVEKMLTSYWGGMVHLGAKTVWEEYCPEMSGAEHYAMYGRKYEKSLCHAWGAGPIYLFGRYYLGVYATAPGYETFNVEPQLGGLEEICGTVPVNGGTVTVKLNKSRLSVLSSKPGGTLLWGGKKYTLTRDVELSFDII